MSGVGASGVVVVVATRVLRVEVAVCVGELVG